MINFKQLQFLFSKKIKQTSLKKHKKDEVVSIVANVSLAFNIVGKRWNLCTF